MRSKVILRAFTAAPVVAFALLATLSPQALAFETAGEYVNTQVLGTVDYQGGFLQDATVNFAEPVAVTTFSVEIPTFCAGVEVLEAGYSALRGPTRAAPVAGHENHFAIPAGTPVTALWVTLNGPVGQACVVPLLSQDDQTNPPVPGVHELDGRYTGTRNVQMEVANGRVIHHNLMLQMAGVPNPSPIHFTSDFTADAYLHGRWDARAIADQLFVSPFNGQWIGCRVPLDFKITGTPGRPDLFSIAMTSPAMINVDAFGRCVLSGSRIDTATIQRMP